MILTRHPSHLKIPSLNFRRLVSHILRALRRPTCDLDVTLVGEARVRALNRKFRGKNHSTDVLSFPLYMGKEARQRGIFLGDVVISIPTARRQAKERNISLTEELTFLLVHGILHLMDYDHERSHKEAARMQAQEKRLMKQLRHPL